MLKAPRVRCWGINAEVPRGQLEEVLESLRAFGLAPSVGIPALPMVEVVPAAVSVAELPVRSKPAKLVPPVKPRGQELTQELTKGEAATVAAMRGHPDGMSRENITKAVIGAGYSETSVYYFLGRLVHKGAIRRLARGMYAVTASGEPASNSGSSSNARNVGNAGKTEEYLAAEGAILAALADGQMTRGELIKHLRVGVREYVVDTGLTRLMRAGKIRKPFLGTYALAE